MDFVVCIYKDHLRQLHQAARGGHGVGKVKKLWSRSMDGLLWPENLLKKRKRKSGRPGSYIYVTFLPSGLLAMSGDSLRASWQLKQ